VSWRRVFVLVEGPTERRFLDAVLRPHLQPALDLTSIIVTTRRERSGYKTGRGGGPWKNWRNDLRTLSYEQGDPRVRFTTMIDLYGLPHDFPGIEELRSMADTRQRAERAQALMAGDIGDPRLIPYVQRHELEALIFADLDRLRDHLDSEPDLSGLTALSASVRGLDPEDIDDGPLSAPSKRLLRHIPSYRKTHHGPNALESIGLRALRARCPRFHAWVSLLESL
jgi:hypothetical protein